MSSFLACSSKTQTGISGKSQSDIIFDLVHQISKQQFHCPTQKESKRPKNLRQKIIDQTLVRNELRLPRGISFPVSITSGSDVHIFTQKIHDSGGSYLFAKFCKVHAALKKNITKILGGRKKNIILSPFRVMFKTPPKKTRHPSQSLFFCRKKSSDKKSAEALS